MDSLSHVVRERFTFLDFYSVHDDSDDSGDISRSLRRRSSSLPAVVTRGRNDDIVAKQQEFVPAHGVRQYTPDCSIRRLDNAWTFDEECCEVDAEDVDVAAIKSPSPSDCCDNSSTKATSEASQELSGGYEHITSVMIRNIPCSFTKKQFIDLLVEYGFSGTFDFVHLPGYRNKRRGNIGYGFVNFIDRKYADAATELITGHRFSGTLSKKVAIVSPAVKNLCGKWSGGSAPAVADTSSVSKVATPLHRPTACVAFSTASRLSTVSYTEDTMRNGPGTSGIVGSDSRCSEIMSGHSDQAHNFASALASGQPWCIGTQDNRNVQQFDRRGPTGIAGGKKKPSACRRDLRKHQNYKSGLPSRESDGKAANVGLSSRSAWKCVS